MKPLTAILALALVFLAGIANHGCELVVAASPYPDHIKKALDRLAKDGKIAREHLEHIREHGRPPDDVMKKIAQEAFDALGLLFINEEDAKDDMRIGDSGESGTALKESVAKVEAVYEWMGKVQLAEPESGENITADMPIDHMLRVVGSVVRAQGLEMETCRKFKKGRCTNDVYTIFGILDPPLVCILARFIVLKSRNLPNCVCIWVTPSPLPV